MFRRDNQAAPAQFGESLVDRGAGTAARQLQLLLARAFARQAAIGTVLWVLPDAVPDVLADRVINIYVVLAHVGKNLVQGCGPCYGTACSMAGGRGLGALAETRCLGQYG